MVSPWDEAFSLILSLCLPVLPHIFGVQLDHKRDVGHVVCFCCERSQTCTSIEDADVWIAAIFFKYLAMGEVFFFLKGMSIP